MSEQVYMTAKLNLSDGTILYPQVSLDNIVASISDPTLVTVATTSGGKVPTSQLPVVTVVGSGATNDTVPTAAAVRSYAQPILTAGTGTEIINGSTINAMAVNLNDVVVNNVPNNGLSLAVEGNTMSVVGELATNDSAGVIAGAADGVTIDQGVVKFDVLTAPVADGATEGLIKTVGTGLSVSNGSVAVDEATIEQTIEGISESTPISDKTLTPAAFQGALSTGKAVDVTSEPSASLGTLVYATNIRDKITWSTSSAGTAKIGFYDSSTAFPKYASSLVYIMMADVKNTSSAAVTISFGGTELNGTAGSIAAGATKRIAFTFASSTTAYFQFTATASTTLEITKLREFEVTGCFQKAREYIAALSDPDDFTKFYAVDYDEVNPWTYYIDMGTSPAVTLMSGLAYKLNATSGTHVLTTDICPSGYYGEDAHLKLFVGETGSVQFVAPLNLIDALTPNAGHNITIKYRDGQANAYVDDTDIGYVVTVSAGTENGSLYYGLANEVSDYIVFNHELDGSTVTLSGVTVAGDNRVVHVVGNGVNDTIVRVTSTLTATASHIFGVSMTNMSIVSAVTNIEASVSLASSQAFVGSNLIVSGNMKSHLFSLWGSAQNSFTNCVFDNITLTASGAGGQYNVVYGARNSTTITGCTFGSNITADVGTVACIGGYTGSAILEDTTFNMTGLNVIGGNAASSVTFKGTNYIEGTVKVTAGKLYVDTGTLESKNGTGSIVLTGNTIGIQCANNSGTHWSYFKNLTISGVNGNGSGRAAITKYSDHNSWYWIENCTLENNKNSGWGSNIYADGDTKVYIKNTTIKMPDADAGLGCFLFHYSPSAIAEVQIIGSTFTDLRASGHNAGIYFGYGMPNMTIDSSNIRPGIYIREYKSTFNRSLNIKGTNNVIYSISVNNLAPYDNLAQIHIFADTTFKYDSSDATQSNLIWQSNISIGSYNEAGQWIVGGTASILADPPVILEGIGDFIQRDNTTNLQVPYTITAASGTGDGTLAAGLADTTKRFLMMDYNTTAASATVAADLTNRDANIVLAGAEPIFGGTFSLASGTTVDVAVSKDSNGLLDVNGSSVAIGEHGITLKGANRLRGTLVTDGGNILIGAAGTSIGGDGTLDLAQHTIILENTGTYSIAGVTITNGLAERGAVVSIASWRTVNLTGCVITGNTATVAGDIMISTGGTGTLNMTNCVVRNDLGRSSIYSMSMDDIINITGSTMDVIQYIGGNYLLSDTNRIDRIYNNSALNWGITGLSLIKIAKGSTLDFRGSPHAYPVDMGYATYAGSRCICVLPGGSTVYNGSNQRVALAPGLYRLIAKTGVPTGDAAYVVSKKDTTGDGSLYYGFANSSNVVLLFDPAIDTQVITCDAAATVSRSLTVIGNGSANTILDFASVTQTGGNWDIVDAEVRNMSSMAAKLAKCILRNPVCGTEANARCLTTHYMDNVQVIDFVFTSGSGAAMIVTGGGDNCYFRNCTFTDSDSVTAHKGTLYVGYNTTIESCTFDQKLISYAHAIVVASGTTTLQDVAIAANSSGNGIRINEGATCNSRRGFYNRPITNEGTLSFIGSGATVTTLSTITGSGTVTWADTGKLDIRGNNNPTVMSVGSIVIPSGVTVTVLYGAAGATTTRTLTGPLTGTTLTNQGVLS